MTHAASTTESDNPDARRVPAVPGISRYSRVAVVLHWLIAALVLSTIPLGLYSTSTPSPAPRQPGMAAPVGSGTAGAAGRVAGAGVAGVGEAGAGATGVGAPAAAAGGAGATARPPPPPPKSPRQQAATNLHKTVGVVILLLTFVRVGWRLGHKPPPLPAHMSRALRGLSQTSHALFYGLLLAMPISGWWMSSAVPNPRRHAFGFGIFDIPFLPVPQSWPAAAAAKYVHTNLVWLMVGLIVLHVLAALKHHYIDKDDVLLRMLPRRP